MNSFNVASEVDGQSGCEHPRVEREILLGMDTGDKICVQCGEMLTSGEWQDIKRARQQP